MINLIEYLYNFIQPYSWLNGNIYQFSLIIFEKKEEIFAQFLFIQYVALGRTGTAADSNRITINSDHHQQSSTGDMSLNAPPERTNVLVSGENSKSLWNISLTNHSNIHFLSVFIYYTQIPFIHEIQHVMLVLSHHSKNIIAPQNSVDIIRGDPQWRSLVWTWQ